MVASVLLKGVAIANVSAAYLIQVIMSNHGI